MRCSLTSNHPCPLCTLLLFLLVNMATVSKDMSVEHHELVDNKFNLHSTDDEPVFDEELFRRRERSLVRKLDLTLTPMIWILYVFNYLDRNNIA